MFRYIVLLAVAVVACAGQRLPEKYAPPLPYAYAYATQDAEGAAVVEESTDGSGKIVGKYSIQLKDGRVRTVSYWADETGFHADIVTNELGTESKNPADVTIKSSAPTGPEAALLAPPRSRKAAA